MEFDAFERGGVGRKPVMSQLQVPLRQGELYPEQPSISRPAGSSYKFSTIQIPDQTQSQPLPDTSRSATFQRPEPLPDFTLKPGREAPKRQGRTQSRELSAGPSIKPASFSGSSSTSTAPSSNAAVVGNGSMPASSPRAANFAVIIEATSSPVGAVTEAIQNSRKRAPSASQGAPSKRKREAPANRIASGTGEGTGKETAASDADEDDPPSDDTKDQLWVLPPSSQNPKGKAKAKPKGKGAASSKPDATQFQRPSQLASFLTPNSAESYSDLLAEVKSELKAGAARKAKLAKDSIVPEKVTDLVACPFCPTPWPKKPSPRLIRLMQPLLDRYNKNLKVESTARMGMCSLHNEEASIIPQGKAKGWPSAQKFDWSKWEALFFTGGAKQEHQWIMRQMCDRVRNPSSSPWLKACQEKAVKEGARTVTSAKGLMETMEAEQTGYFGEVGASKMLEWLRRAFIDQRIPDSNNPYPDADLRLDADDKQASLHPLNSTSFISRCLVPELACCFIRVREKCGPEEADQIRLESSAYGNAIFPLLAEVDVGQFLDFDLDNDSDDAGGTPPSSANRRTAPDTPSRRSKRIEATAGSSPAAKGQKENREGSQRSKPRLSQTRRGRKVADSDSDDADKSVEFVAASRNDGEGSRPFRPKARPFQRTASTNSAVNSIYDSDGDTSMPSGSQPSRPRPVPKRRVAASVDVDSDVETVEISSFKKVAGKQRREQSADYSSSQMVTGPSQSHNGGRTAGSSKAPAQSDMFGSSQEPIPLLGSDDSDRQKNGHPERSRPPPATAGAQSYFLDRGAFFDVSMADSEGIHPASQSSAGDARFEAPSSAQPPRARNRERSTGGPVDEQWFRSGNCTPGSAPNVSPPLDRHGGGRMHDVPQGAGLDTQSQSQGDGDGDSDGHSSSLDAPGSDDPEYCGIGSYAQVQQHNPATRLPGLPNSSVTPDMASGRNNGPILRKDTPPLRAASGSHMPAPFGNVYHQRSLSGRETQARTDDCGSSQMVDAGYSASQFPATQLQQMSFIAQGQPQVEVKETHQPASVPPMSWRGNHQVHASYKPTYEQGNAPPSSSQLMSNSAVRSQREEEDGDEGPYPPMIPPSQRRAQQGAAYTANSAGGPSSSGSSWEVHNMARAGGQKGAKQRGGRDL
ncbi:unnamed protein product [Tilletia controversa]|uniref:Restriction of telomere capping protein 4 C-terminal domain-containing protein n=1 Tax=Tilletia controversa TaxID=13291 RepID=A0A8X7SVP4_9BASI|nr:hypothetical protein CF328_g5255 [Tilletia controversa]KAE8243946.1 hypothetical protein A4X06_0g6044 [Tilletia controversa]CAD6939066.1 unnamed protein product [Tilletia controversa]